MGKEIHSHEDPFLLNRTFSHLRKIVMRLVFLIWFGMFYLDPFKAVVLRGKWVLFLHMTLISDGLQDRLITLAFGQTIFGCCSRLNTYPGKAASQLLSILGSWISISLLQQKTSSPHYYIFKCFVPFWKKLFCYSSPSRKLELWVLEK